ncbi:TetR/AcrR family transcriptional regulator [Amycolatopsis jejuensis]|uniref:TetR/AcrR family transcriptional regulator n=1 Tax=Amycolatopsis jejuensis TaxID=330084 RepID=UPI000B2AC3BE|nr:TetR/AcrR family transcriptional regulator [Amycolatopsis jejuensis]
MKPLRADAQRNYQRILDVAAEAFAQHGADASLEDIARRAGVGSATLHRHFASRHALLRAVFREEVEVLCRRAQEHADDPDPGQALATWLRDLGVYASTTRGLAALLRDSGQEDDDCHVLIAEAGGVLLDRAQKAGTVRAGVAIGDLLTLVNAISLVTEENADTDETNRLLDLAIDGIH